MDSEMATAVFNNGQFVGCYWLYKDYDLGHPDAPFRGLKLMAYRECDGVKRICKDQDEAIKHIEGDDSDVPQYLRED